MEFQVGDKVEWCGCVGEVLAIDDYGRYPLAVDFGVARPFFTRDGRFYEWHKEPSLKLISRPKKKVTMYKWAYRVNNDAYRETVCFHLDAKTAQEYHPEVSVTSLKRLDYTATEFEVE